MKAYKTLTLFILLMSSVSCGLMTHRDYLSEMEHDDSSFFHPREDFPVVSGDSGRDWETNTERKHRTPASISDQQNDRSQRSLNQELRNLEGKQSETDVEFYNKFKSRFATTSERIYFLKLSHYERKYYLASRGFLRDEKKETRPREEMFGLRKSHAVTGMSKSDVMNNWGEPNSIEVAGNPSFENERWLYSVNGATKYIYFESGRVQGWE